MNFSLFTQAIAKLKNEKLGGIDAQFKLAPASRKAYLNEMIIDKSVKKSAVLALFYPNEFNKTEFVLTLRANYKGTHASQISFPGGKFENTDKNLINTAVRETYEEIGIDPIEITIFKKLTNVYIPPSNFLVTPYMGFISYYPNFKLNNEVAKIIKVDLTELLSNHCITTTVVNTSYASKMKVPCFKLNNSMVWGATAMMLSEIRELLINI
jgi:8-oxo-dGTP pyrophosphatase MutT (NUDIX family)